MKKAIRPLVVGNWKMNPQSGTAATRLAADVKKGVQRLQGVEVVVAPPLVFLEAVRKVRNGSKKLLLGAQNVHWEKLGARTGEVSLPMLQHLSVSHVIIGHSERRAMGEDDETVNKKAHASLKAGLTTIVCVGEKKRDHAGHYLTFVEGQIRKACAGVPRTKLSQLVIAYEPIWAIGTGDTATPEDAHEMKLFIQKVLTDIYGRNAADTTRILYGGSVHARNAEALMEQGAVNGFLVGGSSLKAEEFIAIAKATL